MQSCKTNSVQRNILKERESIIIETLTLIVTAVLSTQGVLKKQSKKEMKMKKIIIKPLISCFVLLGTGISIKGCKYDHCTPPPCNWVVERYANEECDDEECESLKAQAKQYLSLKIESDCQDNERCDNLCKKILFKQLDHRCKSY